MRPSHSHIHTAVSDDTFAGTVPGLGNKKAKRVRVKVQSIEHTNGTADNEHRCNYGIIALSSATCVSRTMLLRGRSRLESYVH